MSFLRVLFLMVVGGGVVFGEPSLEPLRKSFERQKEIKNVVVELRQTKKLPSMKDVVKSEGKLWLVPGKAFRWQMGDPVATKAIYDGKRVYLLDEQKKSGKVLDANDRKVKPLMLVLGFGEDASFEGLKKNFAISGVKEEGGRFVVVLTPKSSKLKRGLSYLMLQVNLKNSFVERVEWKQRDGSVVVTEFLRPQINEGFGGEVFTFDTKSYSWE